MTTEHSSESGPTKPPGDPGRQARSSACIRLHRLLIEYRSRVSFGEFTARPDVEVVENQMVVELQQLLRTLGQRVQSRLPGSLDPEQQSETIGEFVTNIQSNLQQRWRRGDLYGFEISYLRAQFRGQLTSNFRQINQATGLDTDDDEYPTVSDEPPGGGSSGGGISEEHHELLGECYENLFQAIQNEPEHIQVLEAWIRSRGAHGFRKEVADQLADQEDSSIALEQRQNRAYRFVRTSLEYLREQICEAFEPYFAELGAYDEEQQQSGIDALVDLLNSVGIGPPPEPPADPPPQNPQEEANEPCDDTRHRWLRQYQHQQIRSRTNCNLQLGILLDLFEEGGPFSDIVGQPGPDNPDPETQLNEHLDTLYGYYREITQYGVETVIRAWRFYDRMQPNLGLGVVRERVQNHDALTPEVNSVIQAADDRIPFLQLPAHLDVELDPLCGRVLIIRQHCNS